MPSALPAQCLPWCVQCRLRWHAPEFNYVIHNELCSRKNVHPFGLQKGALGKELFESVKQKLQLSEEADYFSLSYKDSKGQRVSVASHQHL